MICLLIFDDLWRFRSQHLLPQSYRIYPNIMAIMAIMADWWVYKLYQIISNYAWNPSRLCISLNSAVSPAKKILPCCCYQLQALSGSRLRKSSVTPPKAATGNRGNSWQGKSQSQAAASVGVTMPFWQSGQTYPNPQRHTMLHNVLSLPSLCGRHVCSHRMTKHIKTWQNMTNHLKDS
jgi:hypothetical protein